jgi:hypothetical protein
LESTSILKSASVGLYAGETAVQKQCEGLILTVTTTYLFCTRLNKIIFPTRKPRWVLFCNSFGYIFYHYIYGCMFCMLLFNFVCNVFLLLCLCTLIVMYVPFLVLCCIALFCVLFVCKCVLYYCHRMLTQLQLKNIYHIISRMWKS